MPRVINHVTADIDLRSMTIKLTEAAQEGIILTEPVVVQLDIGAFCNVAAQAVTAMAAQLHQIIAQPIRAMPNLNGRGKGGG